MYVRVGYVYVLVKAGLFTITCDGRTIFSDVVDSEIYRKLRLRGKDGFNFEYQAEAGLQERIYGDV